MGTQKLPEIRLEDWLEAFLAVRGEINGRPLYSYRCNLEEFESLAAALGEVSPYEIWNMRVRGAAALCLFISEWWRREYRGGWSWKNALKGVGHGDDVHHQMIYPIILKGMRFWKRPIRVGAGGRMFLASLALEGGLPLSLIQEQGTGLQRYFRSLIERLSVFRFGSPEEDALLAEQIEGYLPISFRQQEVFDLTAMIVRLVLNWQRQMGWDGSGDVLQALDRAVPTWRQDFPMDVDDAVALDLLRGLVKDATVVAGRRFTPLRMQTLLMESATGAWTLIRSAPLPKAVNVQPLAQLFEVDESSLPNRFQIHARDAQELLHPIAMATAIPDNRFLLETYGSDDLDLSSDALLGAVELVLSTHHAPLADTIPMGWEALNEAPWLFVEIETGRHRLFGQGSGSTESSELLAAVQERTHFQASGEEGGTIERIGPLLGTDRTLFRIGGEVSWRNEDTDEQGVLRTGVPQTDEVTYRLRGPRLKGTRDREQIFLGAPGLRVLSETTGSRDLPPTALEWCHSGARGAWMPLNNTCCGTLQLRYRDAGQTLFRTRATLLPSGASVNIEPGEISSGQLNRGRAHVKGMQTRLVTVDVPDNIEVSASHSTDSATFEMLSDQNAPRTFALLLSWPQGGAARIELPFPAAMARFVNLATGRILEANERLHWESVSSLRAEASSPRPREHFELEARFIGSTDTDLETQYSAGFFVSLQPLEDGQYRLDLAHVADRCRRMLSITNSPDVWISLRLKGRNSRHQHSLSLSKYTGQFDRAEPEHLYALKEDKDLEVDVERCGPLRAEALALWDPINLRSPLKEVSPNRWELPVDTMATGDWLLVGWEGQACRFRPHVVHIESTEEEAEREQSPLKTIASISNRNARLKALQKHIAALLTHSDEDAWGELAQYLGIICDLPTELFDIVDCLIAQPRALAMVMARLPLAQFRQIWTRLERTPMDWALMPVEGWICAFTSRHDLLAKPLEGTGLDSTGLIQQYLTPYLEHMSAQIRGLSVVQEIIEKQLFGASSRSSGSVLLLASDPITRQILLHPREDVREGLLQRQVNNDSWPTWHGGFNSWAAEMFTELEARCGNIDGDLMNALWTQSEPKFRNCVLNMPALAAMSSVLGRTPERAQVLRVRQVRDFDPAWFECAYAVALTLLLGNLPELVKGEDR